MTTHKIVHGTSIKTPAKTDHWNPKVAYLASLLDMYLSKPKSKASFVKPANLKAYDKEPLNDHVSAYRNQKNHKQVLIQDGDKWFKMLTLPKTTTKTHGTTKKSEISG